LPERLGRSTNPHERFFGIALGRLRGRVPPGR
jgi:hypothetical protein